MIAFRKLSALHSSLALDTVTSDFSTEQSYSMQRVLMEGGIDYLFVAVT